MYETVPNQKAICISGKEPCDINHIYSKTNKESMINAMRDLTPTNFMLWSYLASQQKDYIFAFSPVAVSKETGMKKSTIQKSVRELIDQKYLIQRNDSNVYDFYEKPREEIEEIQIQSHGAEPIQKN